MPLTAANVSHVYRRREPGETRALNDISLSIGQGESVLVAGANGSGKTTLLECLCGLIRPTGGRVMIDGVAAHRARGAAAMSIQFPERALFAGTVMEDVAFGPQSLGLDKSQARERAKEALGSVGVDERVFGRHPRALSHGQRRLVALAGAIAVRPRYLFLDEPTAGLDSAGKARALRTMSELNKGGTAVIVASHDMSSLMGVCGRIIVLENGTMSFDGTPEELSRRDDIGLELPPSVIAARWLRRRGMEAPWNISAEEAAARLRRLEGEPAGLD